MSREGPRSDKGGDGDHEGLCSGGWVQGEGREGYPPRPLLHPVLHDQKGTRKYPSSLNGST